MVIQRWQSVLLLIAVIFMWVFCATPFAIDTLSNEVEFSIHAWDFTPFFLLNVAATIVLTVDIFLYRNLKRQIAVALVAIILLLCSIVYCSYLIFAVIPGGEIVWTGGVVLLLAALAFSIVARHLMQKDLKLLRSYDRMR